MQCISYKLCFTYLPFHTISVPLVYQKVINSPVFFVDVGFEVPDKFVVGYALDYNEYFRDLNVSI